MRISHAWHFSVFVLVMSTSGEAQQRRVIKTPVSCPSCRIILDSIGALPVGGFVGPATWLARGSNDRILLVDAGGDQTLKIYERDSTVRTVGRRGAGPGEYELIRNVLVDNRGRIHVIDGALARHSTYSPEGAFERSTPVRVVAGTGLHAVIREDGSLIINTRPGAVSGSVHVLQHFNASGQVLHQWDASGSPRERWLNERLLWSARNGGLVVVRPYVFAIDLYDARLRLTGSLVREEDWIPRHEPTTEPSDGLWDSPFTPRVVGVWEDAEGLLWLHMLLPSRDWTPGPPSSIRSRITHDELMARARRPRVDSVIEVVDLKQSRVVARSRFAGAIGSSFGGGYIARPVPDPLESTGLVLSRVRLTP
jgi:hypothetical protein